MQFSNDVIFCWMIFGGLIGILCGSISIYFISKKIGHRNLNWRHFLIVASIFYFPTLILPIYFASFFSFMQKAAYTFALIIFLCIKYVVMTKAQENVARLRGLREREKQ
jgi:hypothetical protein